MSDKHATAALVPNVRKEILTKFMEPDNKYGYFHAILPVAGLIFTFFYAAHAPLWQALFLVPLIGWIFYRIYFPLHDCCHYGLVKGRKVNIIIGYILAGFLVTPFESFRREHVFHHIHFSTPQDPGGVDYYLTFKSRREMALFLLSPLVGGTLWHKLKEYFHKVGDPDSKSTEETGHKADYVGYISVGLIQISVLMLLTSGLSLTELWRYPVFVILPGATIFLFLSRLRMFLEHGSLDYSVFAYPDNPRKTSRTFISNVFEVLLFSGAGFRYHYEHHLLPGVPSVHLKTVHEKYILPTIEAEDLRPSYFGAVRELWRNLGHSGAPHA